MLTTSRTYDVEFHRRSTHGLSLSLGQNSSVSDRYDNSPHLNRRTTPASDVENKPPVAHRKRVPVACERCRKRKIKCSGDDGDGRGCVNCKNAGWEGCQFLRVQSWQAPINPALASSRGWQSHRYHPYSSARETAQGPNTSTTTQFGSLPFVSWPYGFDFNQTSSNHPATWGRAAQSSGYPVYEQDHPNQYTTHPPMYMLPDPETASNTNVSLSSNMQRTTSQSLWYDPNMNMAGPSSTSSGMTSQYPTLPGDHHTGFAYLNPSPMLVSLPERALRSSPAKMLPPISTASTETAPLSEITQSSSACWSNDDSPVASQSSSRTSCGEIQDLEPCLSSVCLAQDVGFAYTTNTTENPQIGISAAVIPVTDGLAHIDRHMSLQSEITLLERQRCRTVSQESLRPLSPSQVSLQYGYTSMTPHGRRPHGSGSGSTSALSSGSSYTWNPTYSAKDGSIGDGTTDPCEPTHGEDGIISSTGTGVDTSSVSPSY